MDIAYYKKYEPFIRPWHIAHKIGEGSFGKVFEIERIDDYNGDTYKAALKVITIPQSESEIYTVMDGMDEASATTYFRGIVDEFIEEFRLMSKLEGESNVVSYKEHRVIKHDDGIGWDILILMELLTPILQYTRDHALERDDVVRLGIDMCVALELCKRHNIIHRDIKPENIFVSKNGKFKLGDFGIARTEEKTTGGLSKKGTYTYMAPEVYKGKPYGATVDIYSLGIVLYRYLNNNRVPFLPQPPAQISHTDTNKAFGRRMSGETIPAPANADEQLAEIVLKACAYDPKDRYQSPTEMRVALERMLTGQAGVYPFSHVDGEKTIDLRSEAEEYPEEDRDETADIFGDPKGKGKAEEKTEVMPEAEPKPDTEKRKAKNKPSRKKIYTAMLVGTLLIAGVISFFLFVHDWKPATCLEAESCSICRKERGDPLGHDWEPATCTKPELCLRCGETAGDPLGHDWKPATCTEPEQCLRCGETTGDPLGHDWKPATYETRQQCKRCGQLIGHVKGYIGSVDVDSSDNTISLSGWNTHPRVLGRWIIDCRRFTIAFNLRDCDEGLTLSDTYDVYVRSESGQWKWIYSFSYDSDKRTKAYYTISFDEPGIIFDAIGIIPKSFSGSGSFTYHIDLNDVQVYVA